MPSIPPAPVSPDDPQPTRWLPKAHPTPKYGGGGYCTVVSAARIAAPPAVCFDVVLDAPRYSDPGWNGWIRAMTTVEHPPGAPVPGLFQKPDHITVGTKFVFHVHFDMKNPASKGMKQGEQVGVLEAFDEEGPDGKRRKGFRVGWGMIEDDPISWGMKCQRIQEFVDDGNGGTEYIMWETFYGPIARLLYLLYRNKLVDGFRTWTEGLKVRAETLARESKS